MASPFLSFDIISKDDCYQNSGVSPVEVSKLKGGGAAIYRSDPALTPNRSEPRLCSPVRLDHFPEARIDEAGS
jgi:hypothetical protein